MNRSCRVLVVPIDPARSREAEFWYYDAPQECCGGLGLAVLFSRGWSGEECWSRVQVKDESGEWVPWEGESVPLNEVREPATTDDARAIAPETFD